MLVDMYTPEGWPINEEMGIFLDSQSCVEFYTEHLNFFMILSLVSKSKYPAFPTNFLQQALTSKQWHRSQEYHFFFFIQFLYLSVSLSHKETERHIHSIN